MLNKPLMLILAAAAALAPTASAAVIFSIVPITPIAHPGDTGDALEVLLTNTGPSAISVASFTFGVTTKPVDSDITFTSADFSTSDTYIFFGNSFDQSVPTSLNVTSGTSLTASDTTADATAVTINSGGSFALGRVLYNVALSAAPGSFTADFTTNPGDNSLADASEANVPIDNLVSQTIPIQQVVPEPGTPLLVMGAMLVLAALRRAKALSQSAKAGGGR